MLITLRAVLLALFVAAPFGDHDANLQQIAEDYVGDAVLTCPVTPGMPLELDRWAADKERARVQPDGPGENA